MLGVTISKCRKCGEELNDKNWYPSLRSNYNKICKHCFKITQYKYKECRKEWNKEHPESQRSWAKKNRKKRNAEQQAERHIPIKSYCEFGGCKSIENLERAHIDYDHPFEVLTFCSKHHSLIDVLYGKYEDFGLSGVF